MSGDIVPFGKYKDKPVEIMAADRQYVEWLIQQPWFKDRYGNIYNVVINYQAEPTETPEHNKIQMLFLNEGFVHNFLSYVSIKKPIQYRAKVEFEKRLIEWKGNREEPRFITPPVDIVIDHVVQESVHNSFKWAGHPDLCKWTAAIEIKPTIGDDFPAVPPSNERKPRDLPINKRIYQRRSHDRGAICLF